MFIYLITNKINGKQYVGQTTKDVNKRIRQHLTDKTYIGRALRRYGIESFNISIIDSATSIDVLKEKEKYWIKFYDCKVPKGYNLTDGGDGVVGYKYSLKRRKQISEQWLGVKRSEETRKRMSLAQRGNKSGLGNKSRLGQHLSDEQKKKMSLATKGTKKSEETRRRISETRKKLRISVGNKYGCKNRGRKLSLTHRQIISESNKRRWQRYRELKEQNGQVGFNHHPFTQLPLC